MSTMLRIGPHDHGREMTYEDFLAGDYEEGYRYELIRGEVYVSPQPNPPHDEMSEYLSDLLTVYKLKHRKIVKRLSSHCRVFVPGERKTTCPEPDFALYDDYARGSGQKSWQKFSPFIVVEIVSDSDPDKDYVRNVELYQKVPTILEYWLFDKVDEVDEVNGPTMRVYHRDSGDQDWRTDDYGPDATYTTSLLPGFSLPVSPDAE
jgi:Uma2 family endonuclease